VANADPYEARVTSCAGGSLEIELARPPATGQLDHGSVVGFFSLLSWGQYRWLVIVNRVVGKQVELAVLDGPSFAPRRSDPRTGVEIGGEIRILHRGKMLAPQPMVVTDLSYGGLALKGPLLLLLGDAVEVTLEPDEEPACTPASLLGRVVQVDPDRDAGASGGVQAHVEFVPGQDEVLTALAGIIEQARCRPRRP